MVKETEDKENLWHKYQEDDRYFNDILIAYQPLVKSIAKKIASTLPNHIELDDLISDGTFGLIDAIKKYDSSFGYKFETYASFRIRGEILDKLRVFDWVPRSLRSKKKEVNSATEKLSVELNRNPTNSEIAHLLGWTEDELSEVVGQSYHSSSFLSLDDSVNVDGAAFKLSDFIPDIQSTEFSFDFDEMQGMLATSIQSLSDQQRSILYLYYVEFLSLKRIGELVSLTESRVCQIHTEALSQMWKNCFTEAF